MVIAKLHHAVYACAMKTKQPCPAFRAVWRALTPGEKKAVAALVERHVRHLSNASCGLRAVQPAVAEAIEIVTQGKVPVEQTLPSARWARVKDRQYKHNPGGRPVVLLAGVNK